MNLSKWLGQKHSLAEQLEVMHSICKSVVGIHNGGSAAGVALAPPRMEVDSGGNLHMMGGSIGAPTEYAAPELGDGDDPSPSADVFAVGVIFYEILTGRHPFASDSGIDRDIDPTPLRDARGDLASDVADAIQACLDKDPDWRPKDLDYLLSALEKAAAEDPKRGGTHEPTVKPTVKRGTMRPQAKPGTNPPQVRRPATKLPTASRPTTKPPTARVRGSGVEGGGSFAYIAAALLVLGLGGAGAYFALSSAGVIGEGQPPAGEQPKAAVVAEATPAPTPPAAQPMARATPPPGLATPAMPTPAPAAAIQPTPAATAAPTPEPVRQVAAPATPTPPPAPRATPKPAPTAASPAEAVPSEPATITTLSPPSLKRGLKTIVDVRGSGFMALHKARFLKGRNTANGVKVVRSKFASPELLQLLIEVEAKAPTGEYMIQVFAPGVGASNVYRFEITK